MKRRIPSIFLPLFWSHPFDEVDIERDKKTLLVQALNYGDLIHWKWLVQTYGRTQVRRMIKNLRPTELRPSVVHLVSLLLGAQPSQHAPRRSH